MKIVLLFFVLLNVLFYGWSQWVAPPPGGRLVATVEPDAERLVLFREAYPDIERPAELDVSSLALPEDLTEDADGDDPVGEAGSAQQKAGSAAGGDSIDADTSAEGGGSGTATDRPSGTPGAALQSGETASTGAAAARRRAGQPPAAASRPDSKSDAPAAAAASKNAAAKSPGGDSADAAPAPVSAAPSDNVDAAPPAAPLVTEAPAALKRSPAPAPARLAADTVGDAPSATIGSPGSTPQNLAAEEATRVARATSADADQRCVALGPFARLREATEAAVKLRGLSLQPTQRSEEAEIWAGHWVHLVPYDTREEAIAVVEMLREGGISDLYIEPSGEMRNAVSLGLFSDREGAETRAGRVRRLGVKPQILDRRRMGLVYWLDFALPPSMQIEPATFAPQPGKPIELNDRDCAALPAPG